MWWNKMIFGWGSYQVIWWFLTYSILGWVVESIYMSLCNRKLTNRGFSKGPFCPIYGVGALTAYFILYPYRESALALFVLGSLLATTLEYLTALLMIRIFGDFWWDYTDKPMNYKGILCMESSIAWGFYTIFLFMFLHKGVEAFINGMPVLFGRVSGSIIMVIFLSDFLHSFYKEKKADIPEQVLEWKDILVSKIRR